MVRDWYPRWYRLPNFPLTDPEGGVTKYYLAVGDLQLKAKETLNSAGVAEGSTITIVPEMTAGAPEAKDMKWYEPPLEFLV